MRWLGRWSVSEQADLFGTRQSPLALLAQGRNFGVWAVKSKLSRGSMGSMLAVWRLAA
jgi:hypothetical protein